MAKEIKKIEKVEKISFAEFVKDFKNIKGFDLRVSEDWNIFLPYNTSKEAIQLFINKCREKLIVNWHIKYGEVTKLNPTPDIWIYWS
jgi:hypothetical protein